MVLEEKTIVCKDCAERFVFSSGEQGFWEGPAQRAAALSHLSGAATSRACSLPSD